MTTTRTARILVAALLGCGGTVGNACDNPPLAQIPTGQQLAPRDIERVRAEVAGYFEAMKVYTACVLGELAAAGGEEAPRLTKAAYVVRNNNAVAEADAVLKLFNDTFGAASQGPPPPAPP
jgi:hypothetical protein